MMGDGLLRQQCKNSGLDVDAQLNLLCIYQ